MSSESRSPGGYPSISRSQALYARAENLIPCGTQMLAKGTQQHVKGVAPIYLERGLGSHVWDVDGNEFLDLTMGMGPVSLGYCYPRVDDALREQIARGVNFTLLHEAELEVAELFHRMVPNAERIRFSKTGADVTSAAVRLARAYTGRDKILCCGYHGWHDWYVGVTNRNRGVPKAVQALTEKFPYGDLEALEQRLSRDVACVIMEPVVFQEPPRGYLAAVRDLCHQNGSLLVFDEIWTGFRLALGGAQDFFGIHADLATFSKACANGLPLSVLAGRADLMNVMEEEDFFFFTTFGNEALSLVATRETLLEIEERNVVAHTSELAGKLRDGYNELCVALGVSGTRAVGMDYRSMVVFDGSGEESLLAKSLVQQELIKHGVLWTGFHHLSASHTNDDVAHALGAYRKALVVLRDARNSGSVADVLRGDPVKPVFRNLGIGEH